MSSPVQHPFRTPRLHTRRGAIALYLATALGAIVVLMGFMSSFQVTASLKTLERVHAFRLIDLASESCFEEAANHLEDLHKRVDFPARNAHRDLGTELRWPETVPTPITEREFRDNGVTINAVAIRTAPWLMFQAVTEDRSVVSLERGILQMQVDVTVKSTGGTITRRVTCRRYMSLEPPESGDHARLVVQTMNIYREFGSI